MDFVISLISLVIGNVCTAKCEIYFSINVWNFKFMQIMYKVNFY